MFGPSDQGSTPHELGLLGSAGVLPQQENQSQPPIEQLPPELITKILHLALPPTDIQALSHSDACANYMRALHRLRLVSKNWKDVLDATPEVWALVSGDFSNRQNIANIAQSHNYPLIVHCSGITPENPDGGVSCLDFLQLIEPARHRWQVVWLDSVLPEGLSDYLSKPAPIIETVGIRCTYGDPDDGEVFTLFGHHVSTIRSVNLMHVAFHPSSSPFCNLIDFNVWSARGNKIAVEWIMEVLRGSPHIEKLSLVDLDLQTPTSPQPVTVIQLACLKSFSIDQLEGSAIDYIVRRIEAPNCIQFELAFDGERAETYDPSLLLDSALASFEPVLQNLFHKLSHPYLSLHEESIYWGQHKLPDSEADLAPSFHLCIEEVPFLAVIRWVDRVVDPTRSGRGSNPWQWPLVGSLNVTDTTPLRDPEIASHLKRLKSVTSISAELLAVDVSQLLRILGEAGSEPWFPCLRQLTVHAYRWEAQELLEMLRARCSRQPQLVPQFTVIIRRQIFPNFPEQGNRVVFDHDVLREIRAMKGVSVVHPGGEDAE